MLRVYELFKCFIRGVRGGGQARIAIRVMLSYMEVEAPNRQKKNCIALFP